MGKKELKAYNLSAQIFDELLIKYSEQIETVNNICDYVHGYKYKYTFVYNGFNQLIILENYLYPYVTTEKAEWMQCICYRRENQTQPVVRTYSGGVAYRIMHSKIMKICKFKDEEAFANRMNQFTKEYDSELNQLHFEWQRQPGIIYKYTNCRKYDINGAYAKALITIFPEAKNEILKIYRNRKIKPENKDLINFFVGMFAHKDSKTGIAKYAGTYNWIVQNVRKQMNEAIEKCDGVLLYANTDGFAITAYENTLKTSQALGDFKLEYEGDIYTFAGSNYWIMQCGNKLTGNALYQTRHLIQLDSGKAVKYNRGTTECGRIVVAENLQQITCEIEGE